MTDCLLVGGGAIGMSIAYELSRQGQSVVVIDRDLNARPASWAGAGILPPANRATARDAWEEICGLSVEMHPHWARQLTEQTGIDTGYRTCGGLYVARTPGEAASLEVTAAEAKELEIAIDLIDTQELLRREPNLRELATSAEFKAAYFLPGETQVRNPWHLRALRQACQQQGVTFTDQVEVTGLQTDANQVTGLLAGDQTIKAKHYCLTSGAWTGLLLEQLGYHLTIEPFRGQIALFHCEKPLLNHIYNEGYRYLVPREDGRLLVGSTVEEAGFLSGTTEQGIDSLTQFACQVLPQLREIRLETSWAGLRPHTADGYPYLGPIPGLENASVAAGHFRSGLTTSTGTARVMAQLIAGQTPEIDLSMFRLGR